MVHHCKHELEVVPCKTTTRSHLVYRYFFSQKDVGSSVFRILEGFIVSPVRRTMMWLEFKFTQSMRTFKFTEIYNIYIVIREYQMGICYYEDHDCHVDFELCSNLAHWPQWHVLCSRPSTVTVSLHIVMLTLCMGLASFTGA